MDLAARALPVDKLCDIERVCRHGLAATAVVRLTGPDALAKQHHAARPSSSCVTSRLPSPSRSWEGVNKSCKRRRESLSGRPGCQSTSMTSTRSGATDLLRLEQ